MPFYKLDTNNRHSFIAQTTVSFSAAWTKEGRKKSNYWYFLMKGEDSFRVSKSFYLSTLAISQKMVYNVHQKKNILTGMLKSDGWGKHNKHTKVSDEQKNVVICHIDSFPVIESHYCRAKTNKYLEAGLRIQRMYDLCKEKCIRENKPWVKSTYYRYIFSRSYNIDFLIAKTDQCEKCKEIKIEKSQNISISIEEKNLHDLHIAEKLAMREEKKKDKLITNKNCLLVAFDLKMW